MSSWLGENEHTIQAGKAFMTKWQPLSGKFCFDEFMRRHIHRYTIVLFEALVNFCLDDSRLLD